MGVYIKGMEKPRDCNACFLDLYDRQTYCRNGEKALCPLIEVKAPHGRLIDADMLEGKMYHEAFETDTDLQKWESGCWIRYKMLENNLETAPTVIEGEESK